MAGFSLVTLTTVACAAFSPSPAAARQGACLLEIGGKSFIDGPCEIEDPGSGNGSIIVRAPDGEYFACPCIEGDNQASAHWNGAEITKIAEAGWGVDRLGR